MKRMMMPALVGLVLAQAGCKNDPRPGEEPLSRHKLAALPAQDGQVLYSFLLDQIPEVVAKVPCSCCGKSLEWCYRGGCPPS